MNAFDYLALPINLIYKSTRKKELYSKNFQDLVMNIGALRGVKRKFRNENRRKRLKTTVRTGIEDALDV